MFTESKVGTGEEMATSSEKVDQDALETRTERWRRFKNCYFTILVAISVIGFAFLQFHSRNTCHKIQRNWGFHVCHSYPSSWFCLCQKISK